MSVTLLDGKTVEMSLPLSDCSAQIHLFGATVTSWKCEGEEKLFLSQKSNLDGSSAIRGGIPLIFPVFGPVSDHQDVPQGKGLEHLPRHGFVRDVFWSLRDEADADADAGAGAGASHKPEAKDQVSTALVLKSTSNPSHFSSYRYPFTLTYTVTLTSTTLTTSLKVTHDSTPSTPSDQMPFQALLHNYLRVPSSESASVQGLKDLSYLDKTSSDPTKPREFNEAVLQTQSQELDSVFIGSSPDIDLSYGPGGGGIRVTRKGFKDTTIWNPGQQKSDAMKDMQENGWKEFLCVEPGYVRGWVGLENGQSWVATQTLQAL